MSKPETIVVKCPHCGYDYTHIDWGRTSNIDSSMVKGLMPLLFKNGASSALFGYCEADRHVFMLAVGEHKGQTKVEIIPVFDEDGDPEIWMET